MVDTDIVNGDVTRVLPDVVELHAAEARRIPAPGTQRDLRAQTGKSFEELAGPDADGADRIQTLIWIKLRRSFPGLRWDECADVDIQVEEGVLEAVDPTRLSGSATSPPSAGSGG
ncbi:MAG TPA: hypothetical protein VKB57_11960 [Acidimicrobiales bacterium]|nr:hypothetical protein [Acidimicrobiales bacterium]